MSWFRKSLVIVTAVALGGSVLGAKKEETPKSEAKAAKKEGDRKSKADGKKPADDSDKKMSLPIPEGHPSKGLKIPYRDADGKLQMTFDIGVAQRIDANHVKMSALSIETFDDAGASEMNIDLPSSVLDLSTRVISTKEGVVIKRADFQLRGQTMEFNTETKQGRVAGKVHMTIYDLQNETTPISEETPRAK